MRQGAISAALSAALIVASIPAAAARTAARSTIPLNGQGAMTVPTVTLNTLQAHLPSVTSALSAPTPLPTTAIPTAVVPPGVVVAPRAVSPFQLLQNTVSAISDPKVDPADGLGDAFDSAGPTSPNATSLEALVSATRPAASRAYEGDRGPEEPPHAAQPSIAKKIQQRMRPHYESFLHLLRDTAIEVLILGALGLGGGIYIGHDGETDRGKVIPLGFSEVSQIERDLDREHKVMGPMARYLTGTNDLTMKIFESWNMSHESTYYGDNTNKFARELENHMDPASKFHRYSASDFFRKLPAQSDLALAALSEYTQARGKLAPVNAAFAQSWDDSHIAHYRTEWYTHRWTDADGKSHSERRTRRVYDHTRHHYDYNRAWGEVASTSLNQVLAQTSAPVLHEELRTASKTNADGEYAAEKSRKKIDKNVKLSGADYQGIADTWLTGSTLWQSRSVADAAWSRLPNDAEGWRRDKATARSDSYNTYSRSDSGPAEFQTAERALRDGSDYVAAVDEVAGAIEQTKADLPVLEHKVRELIDQELNGTKGTKSSQSLMGEIMKMSRAMYTQNFKNGFDVDPYRIWMVAIWGFAAMIGGGLIGKALDHFGHRKGWYEKLLHRLRHPWTKTQ
jgi:hypothetical protein